MSIFKKTQKITLSFLLIVELFVVSAAPASAGLFGGGGGIKMPSPSQVAGELENRYHLELGAIQNQGEFFNTSDNKKPAPEVTLMFSPSDPKPGEKISAKAFPSNFWSNEEGFYFTWYLQRKGCGLGDAAGRPQCNYDGDGDITVEDWKIAAHQIIAQNGLDVERINYAADTDGDGYLSKHGGDNRANTPDRCYVHDNSSGRNFEITKNKGERSFSCPDGMSPVCLVGEGSVASGTNDIILGNNSYFDVSDTDNCYVSGYPYCATGGVAKCSNGEPRCITSSLLDTSEVFLGSCGSALSTCTVRTETQQNPVCPHIFPNAPGYVSGDGSYSLGEEKFWGTDPTDADTADNGNKDEANITGLGLSSFTWNYQPGDKVGVAVEGTSMIATKHDDASLMIMWAMPKKKCSPYEKGYVGSYNKNIRGYNVTIPTVSIDLNDCLKDNLVDPTEGGQATNLDVNVTATPDYPINDETADKGGDLVSIQASTSNAGKSLTNMVFDWRVDLSDNIQFSDDGDFDVAKDIGAELQDLGLLGNIRGNGLDTVNLKLDIPAGTSIKGRSLSSYLIDGTGYVRFRVEVTENFNEDVTRRGRSDVIVRFTSTGKKITAYKAATGLGGDNKMKVELPGASGVICNDNALDRKACRVIKNEIIGLGVDGTGLKNFKWTINGKPLECSSKISAQCNDNEQVGVNFFPVTGNPGDTYTVVLTANDTASYTNATSSGTSDKVVTLARTFHVVEPEVLVTSADENTAWRKLLGQYKDITGASGCPDGLCSDYSETVLQTIAGNAVELKAEFVPGFLGASASKEWLVDYDLVTETGTNQIAFAADKPAPGVYSVSLNALTVQSPETRRALYDIWDISPLDSPEIHFSKAIQIEVEEAVLAENASGSKKYWAAIVTYVPSSLLFAFRIIVSGLLILFVVGFVMALTPERSGIAPIRQRF